MSSSLSPKFYIFSVILNIGESHHSQLPLVFSSLSNWCLSNLKSCQLFNLSQIFHTLFFSATNLVTYLTQLIIIISHKSPSYPIFAVYNSLFPVIQKEQTFTNVNLVIPHFIYSILCIAPLRIKCKLLGWHRILLFYFNFGLPLHFITPLHRMFSFFI